MIIEIIFAILMGVLGGYISVKFIIKFRTKKMELNVIEKLKQQDMIYVHDGKKMKFNFDKEVPTLEEIK